MDKQLIVYVDESGEASTNSLDKAYPVFVLACCVFDVETYILEVVPAFQKLKFDWFGHDQVVFHSSDIRRKRGDFQFLNDPSKEAKFTNDVTKFVMEAKFEIYAESIDKIRVGNGVAQDLYPLAVISSLQRIKARNTTSFDLHGDPAIVFESRGRHQDDSVRRALETIGWRGPCWFSSKLALSTGLQIADLVARPIGISALGRSTGNAPFEAIKDKLR